MNIPGNIITLILGILLTMISLWYGQNHGLMPIAASKGAEDIDEIFDMMMTISTGLFLLVEGVLVYCLFKFRRRKGDRTDGPSIEGNVPLEIFWTAIPTVIVLVLAIYSFEVYNDIGGLDPVNSRDFVGQEIATEDASGQMVALNPHHQNVALGIGSSVTAEGGKPLQVNVNGIQYAWIFTYPDTGIVSGELHVPVNRPVQLNISAGDVLHAFWLPQLRLKQDAIPGRDSTIGFTANRTGDYPIVCAELCGAYHGGMKSVLHVESAEDYQQWIQDNTIAELENSDRTVALNSGNLSESQLLSLYTQDMGVNDDTLEQLHHLYHQQGEH